MPPRTAVALGRRKYHGIGRGIIDAGERKCAFESCNALEFRTTGYCLRHKGGAASQEMLTLESRSSAEKGSLKESAGVLLIVIGILPSLFGFQLFLRSLGILETTHNPFEIVAALFFLGIGISMLVFDTYWFRKKSDTHRSVNYRREYAVLHYNGCYGKIWAIPE